MCFSVDLKKGQFYNVIRDNESLQPLLQFPLGRVFMEDQSAVIRINVLLSL